MKRDEVSKGTYEARKRGWKNLCLLCVSREEAGEEIKEYGLRVWKFILLFEVPKKLAKVVEKRLASEDKADEKADEKAAADSKEEKEEKESAE